METILAQLQDLFKADNDVKRDDSHLAKKEEELAQQISILENKKWDMKLKRGVLESRQYDHEITLGKITTTYNNHVCKQWFQNCHFRLPYELRQMIYERLPLQERFKISGKSQTKSCSMIQCRLEDHLGLKDFADPDLIKEGTGKELAESIIKRTKFYVQSSAQPEELLFSFFQTDAFGLGIDLFAHVRYLRFAFDTNKCGGEGYEVDTKCLDLLKKLPRTDVVSFRIFRSGSQVRVLEILEALSSWLYDARDAGYQFGCGFKINRIDVNLWKFMGTSMADFAEFKATWPAITGDQPDDDDRVRQFLQTLGSASKKGRVARTLESI